MKKYIVFIVLGLFFLSSCSLRATYRKKSFLLQPNVEYTAKHKTYKTIEVKLLQCDSRFDSNMFYYRKNSYEFMPYATVNWIDTPCYMIQSDIMNSIDKSGMFKMAIASGTLIPYQYRLEFSIEDLEPVFTNKSSYILMKIHFFLFDNNNNLISSYLLNKKEIIRNIHVQNVVNKMNDVVKTAIITMLQWLEESVK